MLNGSYNTAWSRNYLLLSKLSLVKWICEFSGSVYWESQAKIGFELAASVVFNFEIERRSKLVNVSKSNVSHNWFHCLISLHSKVWN